MWCECQRQEWPQLRQLILRYGCVKHFCTFVMNYTLVFLHSLTCSCHRLLYECYYHMADDSNDTDWLEDASLVEPYDWWPLHSYGHKAQLSTLKNYRNSPDTSKLRLKRGRSNSFWPMETLLPIDSLAYGTEKFIFSNFSNFCCSWMGVCVIHKYWAAVAIKLRRDRLKWLLIVV